jgi:hypothetical protein
MGVDMSHGVSKSSASRQAPLKPHGMIVVYTHNRIISNLDVWNTKCQAAKTSGAELNGGHFEDNRQHEKQQLGRKNTTRA